MAFNSSQNPQYVQSYFSNLLHYKSFSKYMWDFDAAELQAFQMFRNSDIFAPSQPTMTSDGSFNTPIKNVQLNQAIIATTTQNGAGLDITFVDPQANTFYVNHTVEDNNMYEGIVVSAAPGKITINPVGNPNTLTQGTYFQNNTILRDTGFLAANMNSLGDRTLYDVKDVQQDWTQITRANAQIARREKLNTYVSEIGGEEVFYGYYQTEADTFNRFMYWCNRKLMFGWGQPNVNTTQGVGGKTMGIRNRIIKDSANYINTGSQMTQADFENMIEQCLAVNPNYGQHLKLFPGIRAARQIASFYPAQTAFAAATKSQLEGNKGDSMSISLQTGEVYVAGAWVQVILNLGLLNSKKIQDWHKDSVYALNMSPTVMAGKDAKCVQLIHSSDDANSTSTMIRYETPGLTSSKMGNNVGMGMINQNMITTSGVDGTEIGFEDDSGVAMIADGSGLFEYIHN